MTSWQRRLRAAIAVFGVGFAILVFFAIRQPPAPAERSRPVAREDPAAAMESTGCEIFQLRGDREDFRIECERSVTYAGGRQLLHGVRISARKQGRDIRITSREAESGGNEERVLLRGDVEVTTSDGMVVKAPEASYNANEGIVRASGDVAFQTARIAGTSVGMTYDEARDSLSLPDKAVLRMPPAEPGGTTIDITAGAANIARPDRYIRFEGGFRLVDGPRLLESDLATAFLSEDESRLLMLEMRGGSRVSGMGDAAGALRGMAARDIDLEFGEDGRTLAAATLLEGASIDVAASGTGSRRIQGARIDARLAPDGLTLSSLAAAGAVRLDLPADAGQPARAISAASLAARGETGKGLTAATFSDDVVYRETADATRGGSPVLRVARSRRLDLDVQPGFGAVDDARFEGNVRFEEGTVRAAAATVRYRVQAGALELEGRDDTTGQMPRVSDELIAIEAQQVRLGLEGRKIDASGEVRSTMLAARPPAGGSADVKRPSMLKADEPVYATAATLAYDGSAKLAAYDTSARLWQGDTAIQGDRLTLDDETGNLTAAGHVRSTLMLEQRDEAGTIERVPTIAGAESLAYDEAARRATYTTGAHVAGPQGDLRAARVELYLKASGTEMDRVEGYDDVSLKLDDREATGSRLTYFAADQRYLMSGQPVRMLAECRETVGRSLTFFRSTDRIVVDGRNEIRTFTRGGAKCGEPRAQ